MFQHHRLQRIVRDFITSSVLALSGSVLALAGCDGIGPASPGPVGMSNTSALAVAVAAQGNGDANVRITATDEAQGGASTVEHVTVHGGSTTQVVIEVPPSSYKIDVAAFADATEQQPLGSGEAQASVSADTTTVIDLKLSLQSSGGGGSGGVGVAIESHQAPTIKGLSLSADGALGGNIGAPISLDANGNASGNVTTAPSLKISLDASAAGSAPLRFFWIGSGSGSGDVAVEGDSSLSVSAQSGLKALVDGSGKVIHVVVQDARGAASALRVELMSTVAGAFTAFHATTAAAADVAAKVGACVQTHAACVAQCDAAADANQNGASAQLACLGTCGLQLSTCENQ